MRLHPDKWLDLTGKTGLDCWGLARTIFDRLGVDVGFRLDSSDDWQPIDGGEPGALVMIGPTHCGVCLDADQYIHVRQGEAVAVASLKALRRSGKLSGIYRHLGRVAACTFDPAAPDTVRVVHIARPVDRPYERESHVIPWTPGMTVGAVAPPRCNVFLGVGGPVALDRAACVPVEPGSTVLFVTAPGEPATLTALGIGLGLSLLSAGLQFLLAPKTGTQAREESSPTFDIGGIRNTASVGIAQPVVYGERRVGGNFAAAYQQVDATGASILYLLSFVSRGPVESIAGLTADADDVQNSNIPATIEIDGNAASNYDCSASIRLGNSDQDPIPGFEEIVTAFAQTPTLLPSTPFTYATTVAVDGFDLQLTFPTGLVDVTNSGVFANRTVKFYVRYRVTGTTTWTETTWTITEAKNVSFLRQFSKRGLTREKYDIQIERYPGDGVISAPWPESAPKFFSQSVLTTINEITGDQLSYPGKAIVALKIRATDQLSGSIPTATVTMKGRKVWVWDGLSTTAPDFGTAEVYSDNPAWCALDYLLNKQYGLGRSGRLTLDNIDLASFDAWADLCDTLVDDGRGGTTKRATCDAIFDSVASGWQGFVDLCRSAWAEPYIAGNKIKIALLTTASPVFLFGGGNTREVTITTLGRSQRPNAVEVQYFNEEANYDADTAKRTDEAAVFTNGEPENVETVGTVGVTRPAQAYRLAAFRRNWHQLVTKRAEWTGGPDSIHLFPGEVVALVAPGVFDGVSGIICSDTGNTNDVALDRTIEVSAARSAIRIQHTDTDVIETAYIERGTYPRNVAIPIYDAGGTSTSWSDAASIGDKYVIESLSVTATRRLFRIESIEERQDLTRRFVGTTYTDAIFSDDFGDLEDFTDELPNVRGIPASAVRVTATESTALSCDGSTCDAINVTFDLVESWQRAEVWYRVATTLEGTWRFAGWSRGAYTIVPVGCGVAYEVAVVVVANGGTRQRIEDAAKASVFIVGRTTPPSAPSAAYVTVSAGGLLHLTTIPPDDATVAGYEVRYGNTWGGSVRLARAVPAEWTAPCPFVGTETIRVRSVGRNGILSIAEVTASATHGAAESVYTVDVDSNDHSAFAGTKSGTVVTGSELALDTGQTTGTYTSGTKAPSGATEQVHLRVRCDLADVDMTWDEAAFQWGDALASSLTWATAFLSGAEVTSVVALTWEQAGFTWDGLQASLRTWAGPTDVHESLTPAVAYDVNTGGGLSGSYTAYTTPPTFTTLTGLRTRITLNRPHTRYDPRLVEMNTTTLSTAAAASSSVTTRYSIAPVVFWG